MIVISAADQPIFQGLSEARREKVNFWIPLVNALLGSEKPCQRFREVAQQARVSEATVIRKYYRARKEGWRGLLDGRGVNAIKVPNDFIPFWHELVLKNKRVTSKAVARFVEMWRKREPIPGFAGHPNWPALPFTERTLYRKKYLPPKAAVAMARQGIAAARAFLPHCLQDVSHARPLEYVLFDDVELDFLIVVRESPTPVKLRLIVAMDLCSRVILGYGVRPGLTRPDGVEDSLKLRDMKMVVGRLLRTWGIPVAYAMNFIVERATAALPDATKTALAEISDGRIITHDTSMIVAQVFEFRDKASGNSWGKAWLESFFNPLHGELADQPGQKGRRYDLAPAELEGRRKELAMLVRAGRSLPIELRYQFRWPFLEPAEAIRELDAALARLHSREHHSLQGFEKTLLWKMCESDSWKPGAELALWPDLIGRVLTTSRVETPMERLQRKLAEANFDPVADCSLQRLMEEQKRVRFESYQFAFEYQKEDFIYLPDDALLARLEHERHYLLWFHPQEMNVVYVTRDRPHLGYVGKLTRFTRQRRGDLEAAKQQLRETQRMFNHAVKAAQGPSVSRLRARAADLAHNTEIVRNSQALECEVDVVLPNDPAGPSAAPKSILTITDDIAVREQALRDLKKREQKARERTLSFDQLPDAPTKRERRVLPPEECI